MSFFNLYSHNFIRAAVAIPEVRVADPEFNSAQTISLITQATQARAVLVVLPELGLSAYSSEDLFHQQALLNAAQTGLAKVLESTRDLPIAAVVGLPSTRRTLFTNSSTRVGLFARSRSTMTLLNFLNAISIQNRDISLILASGTFRNRKALTIFSLLAYWLSCVSFPTSTPCMAM